MTGDVSELRLELAEGRLVIVAVASKDAQHRVPIAKPAEQVELQPNLIGDSLDGAGKLENHQAIGRVIVGGADRLAHVRRPCGAGPFAQAPFFVRRADLQPDMSPEKL